MSRWPHAHERVVADPLAGLEAGAATKAIVSSRRVGDGVPAAERPPR